MAAFIFSTAVAPARIISSEMVLFFNSLRIIRFGLVTELVERLFRCGAARFKAHDRAFLLAAQLAAELGDRIGDGKDRATVFRLAPGRGDIAIKGDRQGIQGDGIPRSEEHTSELQSRPHLVCRLLLEKKKKKKKQ